MSNVGIKFYKLNQLINFEFFVQVMDMLQLDFYLAIFLQLDKFEVRSSKSAVNIFTALLFFMCMMFIKVLLFFKSTRIAIIKKEGVQGEKGYKKNYYNFMFLSERNHGQNYYSNHQEILNLIKDPILAFFLVFFSKKPTIQIGAAFLITTVYFLLELMYKPSLSKTENFRNLMSNGIYALTNFIFLLLHLTEGKISSYQKENYIGWPLIGSVVMLILSNYVISMRGVVTTVKRRCKDINNKISQKNRVKLEGENTTSSDESMIQSLNSGGVSNVKKIQDKGSNKVSNRLRKLNKGNKIRSQDKKLIKTKKLPKVLKAKTTVVQGYNGLEKKLEPSQKPNLDIRPNKKGIKSMKSRITRGTRGQQLRKAL